MPGSLHIPEAELALFISGDVNLWKNIQVRAHVAACESCRARLEGYRSSRQHLKDAAAELPEGADWDRLAAEMTANIRVGLEAGECVAPRRGHAASWKSPAWANRKTSGWKAAGGWKAAAAWGGITAGVIVLLGSAFVLNLPSSDSDALVRVMHTLVRGDARGTSARPVSGNEDRGPVVEASASGVELRQDGVAISIPRASTPPVAITVSAPGSASARYVDEDTGQVIVSSVYAQ